MTKARDLGKLVSQGEVLADGVVQAAEVTGLASVATSGSYTDLTNKPTIPTVPTLAAVATSGSYADLTNKPTIPTVPALATVATSGSYADLTNKPTIPSGSYTDLTNKPTLSTVATSGSYSDLTNKPTIPTVPTLATVATTGSYTDLINKPTTLGGGVTNYNDLTNKPVLATVATSGSYADLTNKPTIPSITGLASETYVGTQINNLINAAPATLDTLKEIADQLAVDQSAVSAITTTLAGKANTSSLSTVATTGNYADLTNKPTIPSGSYTDLTNKPTLFSGSYTDLTNKPTITGGIQYSRKTANYTAVDKEGIIADTGAGSFTVTLPATPVVGAQVVIVDGNNWGTFNLTVDRNGSTIEGLAENLILDISGVSVQFIYDGTTWEVFTQAGLLGGNTALGGSILKNETSVTTNQTIATGFNGQSVGPITVNTGSSVTVATGQRWLVY